MSEWSVRVQDHRIWANLRSLGPAIDMATKVEGVTPVALASLERLRAVLTLCGKRLGGSDPLTIAPSTLEALAAYFESLDIEVNGFVSDANESHLITANGVADSALPVIALLPSLGPPEDIVELIAAVNSQRAAVESVTSTWHEALDKSKKDVTALRATFGQFQKQSETAIGDLRTQLEQEKQKISIQSSEQQKAFSEAQETRNNGYTETVLKIQENLNKVVSDYQGQFSTAQENRSREFTTAQTELQKRVTDLVSESNKKLADQDAEFTKQRDTITAEAGKSLGDLQAFYKEEAEGILGQVISRQKEVEKLVGVIGSLGVTSGYQKTANQARFSMWFWQIVALLGMGGVIAFAFYAFLPTMQGDFKWSSFAARVFLTVTVGVLAAYAARQGDRYFEMERNNRKLALELAAIDPFIALFPLEEQHKFKLEIGRRSFAQERMVAAETKSPATALDVALDSKTREQLLQVIMEMAKKLPTAT
jgi:hypothetical protein